MRTDYARPEVISPTRRAWPDRRIDNTPAWCAVDLRDGNQALPDPMTPVQKKRYFQLLVDMGFKEIEIGFPSASADDFQFCRDLIEQDMIPDDVTISVLTQARDHLIKRTMEALAGVKRAICHVYIATSDLHMRYVFGKTAAQTRDTAIEAVRLIRRQADAMQGSSIGLEFSPEEFTDTELGFAVEICDAVVAAWDPAPGEKVILNLPATVERRLPHEYADLIEAFMAAQKEGARSIVSIHAHNDMGTAVAASEMALMAGAERVEGTLFGHGERSGNVDLIVLALNLEYLGVATGLNLTDLEARRDEIVELTGMPVHPRHPYVGELVFTAFSGSHQDAIHKGLTQKQDLSSHFGGWKIPYLHVDPTALGRSYEKFIRINSQSGKGGIAHVLELEYGVRLPRALLIELSSVVQKHADKVAREVNAAEVWGLLLEHYLRPKGVLELINYWPRPNHEDPSTIEGEAHVLYRGERHELKATAPGPIAAFAHALRSLPVSAFNLEYYEEDAIGSTADAQAIAVVQLSREDGERHYGIGLGSNIDQAAVRAIVSSFNALFVE
jgi:2-isopropylmalate synthase